MRSLWLAYPPVAREFLCISRKIDYALEIPFRDVVAFVCIAPIAYRDSDRTGGTESVPAEAVGLEFGLVEVPSLKFELRIADGECPHRAAKLSNNGRSRPMRGDTWPADASCW